MIHSALHRESEEAAFTLRLRCRAHRPIFMRLKLTTLLLDLSHAGQLRETITTLPLKPLPRFYVQWKSNPFLTISNKFRNFRLRQLSGFENFFLTKKEKSWKLDWRAVTDGIWSSLRSLYKQDVESNSILSGISLCSAIWPFACGPVLTTMIMPQLPYSPWCVCVCTCAGVCFNNGLEQTVC